MWFKSANRLAELTTMAGRFPRQVCYFLREDVHRHKENFQDLSRPLILQAISGVCRRKIIADHWNPQSKEVILNLWISNFKRSRRNFNYKEATHESERRSYLPSLIFEHASRLVAIKRSSLSRRDRHAY